MATTMRLAVITKAACCVVSAWASARSSNGVDAKAGSGSCLHSPILGLTRWFSNGSEEDMRCAMARTVLRTLPTAWLASEASAEGTTSKTMSAPVEDTSTSLRSSRGTRAASASESR
eukprot:6209265-Pleurochrysis_carterae.AAC.2